MQRWLKDIPIPRYSAGLGHCSLCSETDAVCADVKMAHQLEIAGTEEDQSNWRRRLESGSSPDGYCEHKAVVRNVIAALCSFD